MLKESDVTAVVMSLGEDYTVRAVESLKRQTYPLAEIISVGRVTPFHKAMNLAASLVKTEFFIQVDADMILDDCCVHELRLCMGPNTGIIAGHLRDPMIGRVSCVKLFRTECFRHVPFKDTISPDTDFVRDILERGWSLVYALRFKGESPDLWHTFGEHRPDYTPAYTFFKYMVEGRRYRYRKDLGGLIWNMKRLIESSHTSSRVALIAMAHGIFSNAREDILRLHAPHPDFSSLAGFMETAGPYRGKESKPRFLLFDHPKKTFKKFFQMGILMRKKKGYPAFERRLDILCQSRLSLYWTAVAGLCHGAFFHRFKREEFERSYACLRDFFPKKKLSFLAKENIKSLLRRYFS